MKKCIIRKKYETSSTHTPHTLNPYLPHPYRESAIIIFLSWICRRKTGQDRQLQNLSWRCIKANDAGVQFWDGCTVVQAIVKNSLLRDSAGKSWNRTKWTPRARRAQSESCRCISMQTGIFIYGSREIARDHAGFTRSAFHWKRTGFSPRVSIAC